MRFQAGSYQVSNEMEFTQEQIRVRLASALLERPPIMQQRDVVILFGFGCAAAFIYPSYCKPGEIVDLDPLVRADIFGVMKIVKAAPAIAQRAGMDPPEDRRMCSSFWEWALKEIHDWQGSLVGGTPRQKEVERQIHLINRSGGVIPDTKKSSRTFAGLLSDSAGEDYDPASGCPGSGEFAEYVEGDPRRGKLLAQWGRFLMPNAHGAPIFRWSEEGYALDRKEMGSIVKAVVGKEQRKKAKTVSLNESQAAKEAAAKRGEPLPPEVVAELRDLRDKVEAVPEMRDLVEEVFADADRADARATELAIVKTRKLFTLFSGEHEPAMRAAVLHALKRGSREALAKQFGVTPEAIRHRGERALRAVRSIFAA